MAHTVSQKINPQYTEDELNTLRKKSEDNNHLNVLEIYNNSNNVCNNSSRSQIPEVKEIGDDMIIKKI